MLEFENKAAQCGFRFIIGVDEAGRGPLAGPVVAAAVCLHKIDFSCPINDSKKLSEKSRRQAFDEIFEKATVGIGMVSEVAIDQMNILNATFMAMELAINQAVRQIRAAQADVDETQVKLLIDGNMFRTSMPYAAEPIVGGDGQSLSIAAASIIAKVYRDRLMDTYDKIYPQYGFSAHKGYPTKSHRQAIKEHGLSRLHRKSFSHAS